MYKKEEQFNILLDLLKNSIYYNYVDCHDYCFGYKACYLRLKNTFVCFCTKDAMVFNILDGRVALCPWIQFKRWDTYIPVSLELPENKSEAYYIFGIITNMNDYPKYYTKKSGFKIIRTYDFSEVYSLI